MATSFVLVIVNLPTNLLGLSHLIYLLFVDQVN